MESGWLCYLAMYFLELWTLLVFQMVLTWTGGATTDGVEFGRRMGFVPGNSLTEARGFSGVWSAWQPYTVL